MQKREACSGLLFEKMGILCVNYTYQLLIEKTRWFFQWIKITTKTIGEKKLFDSLSLGHEFLQIG